MFDGVCTHSRCTGTGRFIVAFLAVLLFTMIGGCGVSGIYQGVSIRMAPSGISLNVNGTQQFTALVSGTSNPAMTWTVNCGSGTQCGTVNTTGLYTAPSVINVANTVTVTASANADPSKTATATVQLVPMTISVISPAAISLNVGQSQQLAATVSGSTANNNTVVWTLACSSGTSCGSISSSGLYSAPASINAPSSVTVTASSTVDPSKSSTAAIALIPIAISAVTPGAVTLNVNQTQQFIASASGSTTNSSSVTWAVSCSSGSCGSISTTGLYTAPATINTLGTVTVTAAASADANKTSSATVTLAPIGISVSPSGNSLLLNINPGATLQFAAAITGSSNTAVTWSASGGGTINANTGLYVAPTAISSAMNVTITASSVADPTKTATSTLTVNPTNTTVDFTTLLSAVDPYTFGVDVTGYPQSGPNITNDANEQQSLSALSAGMMRIGLGCTTSGDPTSAIRCTAGSCNVGIAGDSWISGIKALGAQPLVIVSVNAANYIQDAMNLVKHYNTADGVTPNPTLPNYVKYWVIGNEPDVNGGLNSAYDPKFNAAWDAMKSVDPNIKIGGPAKATFTGEGLTTTLPIAKSGSYSGTSQWLDQFLTDCGSRVDFLDFHKYDLSGSQWSDSPTRLSSSGNTFKYQIRPAQVQFMLANNAASAARAAQIGVELGEWNISSNSGSSASIPEIRLPYDFFNTLYGASALGNMMTAGARGLMYGDKNTALGIVGDGSSPYPPSGVPLPSGWAPPGSDVPMPIYYAYGMYTGMGLFRHYGTEAVKASTTIAAAPNGLDIFASNNQNNIVVVNKNNIAETVTAALTGFTNGTASVWQKAAVNGTLGSNDNAGPLYSPAPPQLIGMLNVSNGGFSLSVPPYSVSTLVLDSSVSVVLSPGTASLAAGGTQQLAVSVSGGNNSTVTWTLSCTNTGNCGSIRSDGLYTAPTSIAVPDKVTITATSAADPTAMTATSLTLVPVVGISVSPVAGSLTAGLTQQFTAAVTNAGNTGVSWSLSCTLTGNCGSIGTSGLYTAPAIINVADTVSIQATASADASKIAIAKMSLIPVVTVSLTPATVSLVAGGSQQFTATVTGSTNSAVSWSLSCTHTGNCGTISIGGAYMAPAALTTQDTVTVSATAVADSTKSATATVNLTIVPVVTVSLSPATGTLGIGGTQQFTATVAGAVNTAVTWALACTGSDCGSISATGMYAVPGNIAQAGTVTITATSVADSTKSASATVSLVPPAQAAPANLSTHPDGGIGGIGSQVGLTWSVATGATSYSVLRATTSGGPYAVLATGVTATYTSDVDSFGYGVYNDTGVVNGTEYYYVVRAVGGNGSSQNSNEAYATPIAANYQVSAASQPSTPIPPYAVANGTYCSGPAATYNQVTSAVSASLVVAPAPMTIPGGGYGIYQQVCYANGSGNVTSTYPNLTVGASYKVRIHFSEDFRTTNASGSDGRLFGVTINGNYVLGTNSSSTNFDAFATAATLYGSSNGEGKAFVKEFTANADSNGKITVVFVRGTKSNPFFNAIEIVPMPPAAPSALVATPGGGNVQLAWGGVAGATSYNIKRGISSGGPYTTIASGVTSPAYTDVNATYQQAYYYVVSAVGATGESLNSNEANATIANSGTDFSILVSGNPQTVSSGTGAMYTIKIAPVNGSPVVNLSFTGLASDGSYTFSPASLSGTASSTLTVVEPTIGTYVLTVTGRSGGIVRSVPVTLSVIGVPDFTISASPATQSITQGGSASISVNTNFLNGFGSAISLSVSGQPSDVIAGLSATTISGFGSATVSIPTTFATAQGTYTVTITGTSGASVHSATSKLIVNGPADFALSSAATSQTVVQGNTASFSVNSSALNGFSGNILLNVDGLPSGSSAAYSTNTVAGTGTSILTVTTGNSTATGSFTLEIMGASGDLVHALPVTLIVQPSGATAPLPPANLSATGDGANAITLDWTASLGAMSYNIGRSPTQGGPYTTIASNVASTVYLDTAVTDSTAYYYVVSAIGSGGTSGASVEANARPHLSAVYQVNAGGNAVGTWSADNYLVAGSMGSSQAVGNLVDTSHVVAPAPMAVYQTMRWWGASPYFSYQFPNLTPSGTYTVRMHFADNWHGGAGDPRAVSASINGTAVLTNFNIAQTAGGQYIAVIQEFTATADSSGNITVTIGNGGAGNPMVNGIEVLSATPVTPMAPASLTAAWSNAAIVLSWNSVAGASGYSVKRSTASGGPYSTVATGLTNTAYTDTTALNGPAYSYIVTATNSSGEGSASNEATAKPAASTGFALTSVASAASVIPGHSLSYVVTVMPVGGFTGIVNLSTTGLPAGTVATFSPVSVSLANATPVTAVLTLATTTSGPSGLSTFTIGGTSGVNQASAAAGFSVAWTLAWSDEFNGAVGDQPNPAYWSYDLGGGGWGNSELECYTNASSNVAEDGAGNLVISATYTPAGFTCSGSSGTYYYQSGRIKTNSYLGPYGRYEARMKLPYGKGSWPAFWMLGNNTNNCGSSAWPACGEIDIMENYSKTPAIMNGTIHRPNDSGGNSCSAAVMNGKTFANAYHTFAIEWVPGSITFFVDDQRCGTAMTPSTNSGSTWVFDNHPFDILLNLAIGGATTSPDATTQWPLNMYVDYVRVFNAAP